MKITNGEVFNIFNNYHETEKNEKAVIPFTVLYKIRKNMIKLEGVYNPLQQTIQDIVSKHKGEPNETALNKDLAEISRVENEVDIEKIPVSAFDNVKVTPQFMDAIFFMLED